MTPDYLATLLSALTADQFERWLCEYANCVYDLPTPAARIGRGGQSQKGVDVDAFTRDGERIGIQAKRYRSAKLTKAGIEAELAAAHAYEPALDRYIIATTNPRDAALQEHARKLAIHGKPHVEVVALENLAETAANYTQLKRILLACVVSSADLQLLVSELSQMLPGPASTADDPRGRRELPENLRKIDDWINAGYPQRALDELDTQAPQGLSSDARRLRCRAYFTLGRYQDVVLLTQEELVCERPDARVLAIGAQAANELGKTERSDDWLRLAMTLTSDSHRSAVVAADIRVRGDRDAASFERIEEFARKTGVDLDSVASALADCAAKLGEIDQALQWYEVAKASTPQLPVGVELNMLCTRARKAIAQAIAGRASTSDHLDVIASEIDAMAREIATLEIQEYRRILWNMAGAVYWVADRHVEAARSWEHLLSVDPLDRDVWIRRCLLTLNAGVPIFEMPAERLAMLDSLSRIVYGSALRTAGRVDEARHLVEQELSTGKLNLQEQSAAQSELFRIRQAVADDISFSEALEHVDGYGHTVAMALWSINNLDLATSDEVHLLRQKLLTWSDADLEPAQKVALVASLIRHDMGDVALIWLADLEKFAFDSFGNVVDADIADLVCNLYETLLCFDDAIRLRTYFAETQPSSATATLALARVQYIAGRRVESYNTLEQALRREISSHRVLLNFVILARQLGRLRQARRFVRTLSFGPGATATEHQCLVQAQHLLGLRGGPERIEGVRKGFLTPGNAAPIFGAGLRRRRPGNRPVGYGSVVQIDLPGVFRGEALLSEQAGAPVPWVDTLDPANHPWVADLLGHGTGDSVVISSGAHKGKCVSIEAVRDVDDWIFRRAHTLVQQSEPSVTGVQAFEGTIAQQIDVMKKQLVVRRDSTRQVLRNATEHRVPIAKLAAHFDTTPRDFFASQETWIPSSHPGTQEAIEADEMTLQQVRDWIFDPVTVLLMVTIGAEELASALPHQPTLTRQAAWQLFDWYMQEREGLRATAHLQLAEDGRLAYYELGAARRAATLKFWRRVQRVVANNFELVDATCLNPAPELASAVDLLGTPTVSGMSHAKSADRALISEEVFIRDCAQLLFPRTAVASLHQLICHACAEQWISRTKATRWLAALINLGWTWIGFPGWMLAHAITLEKQPKGSIANAFMTRLRTAEPGPALGLLINVLRNLDFGAYRHTDSNRLRAALGSALPMIDRKDRQAVAESYRSLSGSRAERATRRMLREWADR